MAGADVILHQGGDQLEEEADTSTHNRGIQGNKPNRTVNIQLGHPQSASCRNDRANDQVDLVMAGAAHGYARKNTGSQHAQRHRHQQKPRNRGRISITHLQVSRQVQGGAKHGPHAQHGHQRGQYEGAVSHHLIGQNRLNRASLCEHKSHQAGQAHHTHTNNHRARPGVLAAAPRSHQNDRHRRNIHKH